MLLYGKPLTFYDFTIKNSIIKITIIRKVFAPKIHEILLKILEIEAAQEARNSQSHPCVPAAIGNAYFLQATSTGWDNLTDTLLCACCHQGKSQCSHIDQKNRQSCHHAPMAIREVSV